MFGQSIPASWSMTTIETVAEVKGGKRLPKGKKLLDEPTDHPYIRVTDFENASVNTQSLKYLDDETYDAIKNYTISDKDLYISIAGTIGLVGTIPKNLSGANLTENAAKIAEVTGVLNPYLSFVLNSNGAIEQFKDKATSSGQPKLALFRIKDCSFPLPPLAEQKVIAEKLDKLLSKVDSIKARLDALPDTLKRFRQSILTAAVSGKLTEEWRKTHGVVLNWDERSLDDVASNIVDCPHSTPKWSESGKYCVRTTAFNPFNLDMTDQGYVDDEVFEYRVKRLKPEPHDILYSREGTVGIACQIPEGVELCLGQRMVLIRAGEDINPKYLTSVLNSDLILTIVRQLTIGSTAPRVNMKDIKSYPIPVPSVNEQTEIVRRVEQLFAYADKVEAKVNAAQERVNKLTQSILAKAFRGELTAKWREQNPDLISGDNSAEALLAKIKAEREKLKPNKKTHTKK
jgi:type I restriction enzyme S subunit